MERRVTGALIFTQILHVAYGHPGGITVGASRTLEMGSRIPRASPRFGKGRKGQNSSPRSGQAIRLLFRGSVTWGWAHDASDPTW